MRWKLLKSLTAAAAVMVGIVLSAVPAGATTWAPFSWPNVFYTWCPSFHGYWGCDSVQTESQFANNFDPAQVSLSRGVVSLAMNSDGTDSGAFNSFGSGDLSLPYTISESISLPCNDSGQIYNWPAFWTVGEAGSWPANGEFDIAEAGGTGSGAGVLTWAYHYVDPTTGEAASVGGTPAGNWCGQHTYTLQVTSSQAVYTWDSTVVETLNFTSSIPAPTDNMYVITDYAYSPTYAGPLGANQVMKARTFSYSPS